MSNLMDPEDAKGLALFDDLATSLRADRDELAGRILGSTLDSTRYFTGQTRYNVWARCDGMCFHCGTFIPYRELWHADHLIPWILGGQTVEENGVVSCQGCNLSKGSRVW